MIYNYRANSEIIFSSKKSEGNREFDENILIDLFKREMLFWKIWRKIRQSIIPDFES